jgi:hypothetical protein
MLRSVPPTGSGAAYSMDFVVDPFSSETACAYDPLFEQFRGATVNDFSALHNLLNNTELYVTDVTIEYAQ